MARAESGATASGGESIVSLPESSLGYLPIVLAAVTGVIHLFLAPQVIGFSQTLGILFALNGLGFLGGTAIYLTRYWQRELFAVAAGYALVTFVAFFLWGGFDGFASAFYMGGELNVMAVIAKTAEVLLVVSALALYTNTET
ncbi:DUF7475 family protein [Haloplanus halobius]|uniref:DUF7475 family protein n=1 Tax=Haloplanus halobius TaxID=2934938 RepID=UPI00200CD7B5|nr:hypothetical protein [Haloplanus sp. XH21]